MTLMCSNLNNLVLSVSLPYQTYLFLSSNRITNPISVSLLIKPRYLILYTNRISLVLFVSHYLFLLAVCTICFCVIEPPNTSDFFCFKIVSSLIHKFHIETINLICFANSIWNATLD